MPRFRRAKVGIRELYTGSLWLSVFAEYAATFLFMFSVSGASLRWEGTPSTVAVALAAGLSMASVTQAFRWVCRPLVHANPCVSLASFLAGDTALLPALIYILAQCFGAITGSGLLYLVSPSHARGNLGATFPAIGINAFQAFGTETTITFLLVSTILSTLDAAAKHDEYARYDVSAAIGLATTACYIVAVPLTGAGLNPARSLGPAILSNVWTSHWVYWCGPLVGAAIAGVMYNMLFHRRSADKNGDETPSDSEELTH